MEDGRCGGRVVLPLGTLSLLETVAELSLSLKHISEPTRLGIIT